jgi:hypothetical protein
MPDGRRAPRFPDDDRLRAGGFRVHERRRGREAVWRGDDGRLLPQRAALAELDFREAAVLGLIRRA